jgi:hypothetical protein
VCNKREEGKRENDVSDRCLDGEDVHPISKTYSQEKKRKSKTPAKTINNNNKKLMRKK